MYIFYIIRLYLFTGLGILTAVLCLTSCSEDKVIDIEEDSPPEIISANIVEATGGIDFGYRVAFQDTDGPDSIITFLNYPSWLSVDTDSIYGLPEDGLNDTSFTVIVSDGILAETLVVTIDIIPALVVYGDSRSGHTTHQAIVNLICDIKPAAVFHTGDLVNDGDKVDDWTIFNAITYNMRSISEFYPALGNHEKQSEMFFDSYELPGNEEWYSVEKNGIYFIILNSCVAIDQGSEQYQWLETELQSIPDSIDFIAAVFHHPPYSTGPHIEDEKGLRDLIVPLFDLYGVDVVFNGHDHCYERSFCGGIYYIVAGGGGAPLYDQVRSHPCSQVYLKVNHFCKISTIDNRCIVKVIDINDELIDQFELTN